MNKVAIRSTYIFRKTTYSADTETVRRSIDAHGDGDAWRPKEGVEYRGHNGYKNVNAVLMPHRPID